MYRDGARKSIWQDEVKKYAANFDKELLFDVAIIGGGITGVSTAHRLQAAGKKCILLEAHNIGFGTSGGTTAHINDFFDTTFKEAISKFGIENARLLKEAGRAAINMVAQQVLRHNLDCDFKIKDAHLFALDEEQEKKLADIVDGAEQVGYSMNYINKIDFPFSFKKAVQIKDQAQFHPVKYLKALCTLFTADGGQLIEDCTCISHEELAEYVRLETSIGTINAKQVIYATHTPPGVNLLHFMTAPYRSYVIAFTLRNGVYPEMLGYDLSEPYHYYRTHVVNGKKLLIAGGEDHKTGHAEDTGACFSKLENYCREHFDVDTVAYSWSSQYYEPVDGLPSIGKLPGSEGRIYVATGFRGNGMSFGSLSATILSDLILSGSSKYEKLFNPARFKPTAGFTTFVKENATVVHDIIKDKLTMEHIDSLGEISPGDAKVVRLDGSSYAAYREQNGKIHLLKSTCPHAKCEVRWNNAELSWDCPCHGSRFSVNGQLLNAPSTSGLKRVEPDL
ncbi:MAG: FAD-dependent oxidoreductase [Sphingobacteriales bacterium]|nr:MAG: FAD-dependent oxidoreductase [Sphingobacteriales bacterium]